MRKCVVILLLLSSLCLSAQSGYSIIYQRSELHLPFTFNGKKQPLPNLTNRLVFTDSICFSYYYRDHDPLKKKTVFSEKLVHHALMYNMNTKIVYNHVDLTAKEKHLVYDTAKVFDWKFLDGTKMVIGYKCNSALSVNERNDSILVWYTKEIAKPFGPAGFVGLPGLVLEVYDQRFGQYLYAVKLERKDLSIVFPKEGDLVPGDQYWKKKTKKQTN